MSTFLRLTRYIVGLFISLHLIVLRGHVASHNRRVDKAGRRVAAEQANVEAARHMVSIARVNAREARGAQAEVSAQAKTAAMAADAEAKFYGRDL